MSTTQRLMSDEDIDGMVGGLKKWPNVAHDNGDFELAISPFLTFYFDFEPERYLEASLALIDVHEDFETLAGRPYIIATHPRSERPHPYGSTRLGDRRAWARKAKFDESFVFKATDEENHRSSPTTAAYYWRSSGIFFERDKELYYSYAQFYYRWQWWLDNRDAWRRFVHATIERLKPEQVYSGFAMANPLEFGTRSEVTVWDRALAPYFYGLDTDYPFGMADRHDLRKGIRPPTWAFFLSDIWREKLDKSREEVHAALDHPRIRIDDLSCGQWIELGEQPDLYPVENGVPLLPVMLNALLKPVRHPDLDLLGFGEWDGDPNVRFNREDTRRWMGRFDRDSDWPDAATRARSPTPSASTGVRIRSGQPCPYPAVWECLDIPVGPQTVMHGVPMPQVNGRDVTWQLVRIAGASDIKP
ncbi:type VI immunity family protein [Lysobacter changpingensis]|uniref:type VI immunity family protein n=1 Tax=Lysobacter changpingensis TaxID=2792784 RepID=UPI001A8CD80D|nr:type VI immunity family protein [Lysobacter changpingensis]